MNTQTLNECLISDEDEESEDEDAKDDPTYHIDLLVIKWSHFSENYK
jgi:hypothetical protein